MMRLSRLLCLSSAALFACATPAFSTTITFDGSQLNTAVGSTYSDLGVEFTNTLFASAQDLPGTSGRGAIYSQSGNYYSYGLADAVAGTFATAATYLSFTASDVGAAGVRLEAFDALGTLLGFDTISGLASARAMSAPYR